MKQSILQDGKYCMVCGSEQNLQKHHIFGGANRKFSDEDGLWIWLCIDHHTGDQGIHSAKGSAMMQRYHEIGEREWLRKYGKTIEQFRRRYGKSWL